MGIMVGGGVQGPESDVDTTVVEDPKKAMEGQVARKVANGHPAKEVGGDDVQDRVVPDGFQGVDEEVVEGPGRLVVVVKLMKRL